MHVAQVLIPQVVVVPAVHLVHPVTITHIPHKAVVMPVLLVPIHPGLATLDVPHVMLEHILLPHQVDVRIVPLATIVPQLDQEDVVLVRLERILQVLDILDALVVVLVRILMQDLVDVLRVLPVITLVPAQVPVLLVLQELILAR